MHARAHTHTPHTLPGDPKCQKSGNKSFILMFNKLEKAVEEKPPTQTNSYKKTPTLFQL